MSTPVSLRQCWADRPSAYGTTRQCKATVPPDVDYIGLCGECHDRLRQPPADEVVRDMRDDAIDSILYGEAV